MKFGKEFRTHLEETLPEWRDKFLCYKPLKKLLKHYPNSSSSTVAAAAGDVDFIPPDQTHLRTVFADTTNTSPSAASDAEIPVGRPLEELQDSFVRILNNELEKFNDFYVDKEEEFVIRLQELKERIERVNEKSGKDGDLTAESEFSEEMMDIRKNLVTIHGEMVLLKNYGSLNFAGLVKILKKYDKRTGGLLRLPFTQLALSQPFFTMEPLTRLVCECEANLEILFPSEAEVVESNSEQSQSSLQQIISKPETSSSLGEENLDIYRSTLAAMKAIRGLQKASSTYNPLSFSSLLKNGDDETVTTENSPDSSGNLQGKDERGKDESESDPSH